MSAIAGIASPRDASQREMLSRRFLLSQQFYGSDIRLGHVDQATFGILASIGDPLSPVTEHGSMLVGDLRLYNRDELLSRLGEGPSGISDEQLLLRAWLSVGEECLSWIAGDFALAIFDGRRKILALARDPTGQMPLHYARRGEEFAFASMPSGLRPLVETLSIDRLALAATVCDVREEDPRSHFRDVARVLPGEIVRLSPAASKRSFYWKHRNVREDAQRTEDLVLEYRSVLQIAVADRLRGCRSPIASHLSSGYDSSAVTATAAQMVPSPDQIIAFTSAPTGPTVIPPSMWRIGDESDIAAATAKTLGIRHVVVRSVPFSMRSLIRRQSLLFQEPVIGVPNIAWLLEIRRQAAALGAECLLSGDSGNFTLNAGGLYVLSEWVRRRRFLTWARQARLAAARADTKWRGVLFNSFEPWLPKSIVETLRRAYLGPGPSDEPSFLRPEWREAALRSAPIPPRHANGQEERAYWIRTGNPGMQRKGGLAGEGVDERDPFADQRVIDFSLRIPPEQLYWDGVQRPLARTALADRVPATVLNQRYRGLQAADWAARFTRTDARAMIEEVSHNSATQDLFDLKRMERAIEQWPTESWNERAPHRIYRQSLIGALSGAMFALVHEQGATLDTERL